MAQDFRSRPHPLDFEDYRSYLRALVTYLKESQPGFSYRQFARRAGYSSSSFLKHVVDGERNLSHESITKFAKALGLAPIEREDFELLVLMSQAQSDAERNVYYSQILRRRRRREGRTTLRDAQFDVYSNWCAIPIREMFRLKDCPAEADVLAARLHPPVRPTEAAEALAALERAKLIRKDKSGKYTLASDTVETPAEVPSLAVRNYHRNLLERALASLDGLPQKDRNVTSLTITMSRSKYDELRKRINQIQDEIMDFIHDDPGAQKEGTEVFQLGFTVVPVTRKRQ